MTKTETERLRDYGYAQTPKPVGVPEWTITQPAAACPNCQATLCAIVVKVDGKVVGAEKANCRYLGCPCCPFASRSITTPL